MPILDAIFQIMVDDHTFDHDYAVKCIEANRHNQITATYHLIHKRELRHNKSIPENPMRMVTSSIDRNSQLGGNQQNNVVGAGDKQVRASRIGGVTRQDNNNSKTNSKRGESLAPNVKTAALGTLGEGGHGMVDLNQTQPAHFYPHQVLQSVNGGEEMLNLNDQDEVSAQKKYKLQLQAEINKLKTKYQSMKKEESISKQINVNANNNLNNATTINNSGSSRVKVQGQNMSINPSRGENSSKSNGLGGNAQVVSAQSNYPGNVGVGGHNGGGEHSPSPDNLAFVQNLQEQLSQTSKYTHQSNGSNAPHQFLSQLSNNTNNQTKNNNGVTKLPSATTTESTVNTSSYNDYNKHIGSSGQQSSSHHQRFRTQIPTIQNMINDSTLKNKMQINRPKVPTINNQNIQKQAWKGQHPGMNISGVGSGIGGVSIDLGNGPASALNKTQIVFSNTQTNAVQSTTNQNALQKFTNETPIKQPNSQQQQQKVLTQQIPNLITIDTPNQAVTNGVKKNNQTQYQTYQNTTTIAPDKSPSTQQKRGKSSTIDVSPDNQSFINNGRKTITQQLNMSTISSNQHQETDYSYPINANQNANRQRNQANKFADLRLQTAIEFQGVRAANNTSQNKNSQVYTNAIDYMIRQQHTIKTNNPKSTLRYNSNGGNTTTSHNNNNNANRNSSISPRGINDSFHNVNNNNGTPNLNISELYKQYSKKNACSTGTSQQVKQNGRALSVIDPPFNVNNSVNQQVLQPQTSNFNNTFSGRHASQTQNQRKIIESSVQSSTKHQTHNNNMSSIQGSNADAGNVTISSLLASKTLYNKNFHS